MFRVPSVKRYCSALKAIRNEMSEVQWRMLEAHFVAPQHRITAGELATVAGHKTYRSTNSIYGRLGTQLREALNQQLGENEQQSTILAYFLPPDVDSPWWRFEMHNNLA